MVIKFKSNIRRKHREHGIQPLENGAAFEVEWGVAYFLHNQPAYLSECLHISSKLSFRKEELSLGIMFHAKRINVPIMTMILNKNRWMSFMTRMKMRMMIWVKMRMTTTSRGTWTWSPSNWRGRTNRRPAYTLALAPATF